MKKAVLSLLIISLFLLTACSNNEDPTGNSVIEVSTLDITVRSEDGSLLPGAEIYINGAYKGKTTKYGENVGVKTVVLAGDINQVHAEKDGYAPSEPTSVSASLKGHQQMNIILEKKKILVQINVEDRTGPVEDARVSLHREDKSAPPETDYTNRRGRVEFEQVDDGDYIVSVSKEGFELFNQKVEIDYLDVEEELKLIVELVQLPGLNVEVLNTNGEPLSFVEVTLYSENDYNMPGGLPINTELASRDGKVLFSSVKYGEKYVVVVKKRNFLAQGKEILLEPDRRDLRFEMIFDID